MAGPYYDIRTLVHRTFILIIVAFLISAGSVSATADVAPDSSSRLAGTGDTYSGDILAEIAENDRITTPVSKPKEIGGEDIVEANGSVRAANGTTVTLLTGQTVTVLRSGNRTTYRVDASVPMETVEEESGTYIYPDGLDTDRFDRELFNVDRLIRQGFTDDTADSIPLIVTERRSGSSDRAMVLGAGPNSNQPGVTATFRTSIDEIPGVATDHVLGSIGAVSGKVQKGQADSAYKTLAADPSVRRVYLDQRLAVALDDVESVVSADVARDQFEVSGAGVTVAVLDTGVDSSHPDLADSIVLEKDFTGEGSVEDSHGHGTHVAGIITGDGTASSGSYVGMAPDAGVMNLRVMGSDGTGSTSDIIDAMEYADENGADIVSMSLGGDTGSNDPFFDAVETITANGTAVVVAAGNSGPDHETVKSPGVVPAAITVGASTDADDMASFSSRGPTPMRGYVKPDLVAPGNYVWSAEAGTDGYTAKSGTSMATPVVSGVGALVLEAHPGWGPDELKSALVTTTDDIGSDDVYTVGSGRLNATAAVSSDLIVQQATTNFGNLTGHSTASRSLNLTNVGAESRTVSLSTAATSLDGASGNVTLNRTAVTLSPGESVHVGLSVTTDSPNGVYSGRVQVDNGAQTAIFGYWVAGRSTLSIEKRAVNATDVDGDSVYVVGHDGPTSTTTLSGTDSSGDLGTTSIPVDDGTYTIYSGGVDESSGQPIVLSKTVSVTGDTTVSVDETDAVRYRLDASDAAAADGPLTTLGLVARLTTTIDGSDYEYEIEQSFPDTNTARFSTASAQNATVSHLLAPAERYSNDQTHLDTPVAYHLVHGTAGVDGTETFVIDRSQLGQLETTYYRSSDGQTYDVSPQIRHGTLESPITMGNWSVQDRATQTVYVTPSQDGASTRSQVFASDDSWSYTGGSWIAAGSGDTTSVEINRPPLTQTGYATVGRFATMSNLTMLVYPRVEQGPVRDVRAGQSETSYTLYRDGSVVDSGTTTDSQLYLTEDAPLPDGTTYALETVTTNTGQPLSTETRSELVVTYADSGDTDPPSVAHVGIPDLLANGTVPAGNVSVDITIEDNDLGSVAVYLRIADGSVSATPYDGPMSNTSNEWTEVPVTAVNVSAGEYTATIDTTAYAGTTMNLEVAATDGGGNGLSTAAYDAVHVGNTSADTDSPPSASFTTNASTVGIGDTIEFDASGSTDDDGISTYEWAFDDSTAATGRQVTHSYDDPGTYDVTLTVTDTSGRTDSATRTMTVEDRTDPSAMLTSNKTSAGIEEPVGFDASGSSDNVAIAEYRWDFDGDGTTDATTPGPTTSHAFSHTGSFPSTVTVVDTAGNSDTATVSIAVSDETPPTAALSANRTAVEPGEDIAFDGSDSTDNVAITEYRWDLDGDGSSETVTEDANVVHAFEETGNHTVTLTVADGAGNTDSARTTIEVTADEPPTARVSANASTVAIGDSVGFDASNSSDDDAIVASDWTFGDESTATGEQVSHAYDGPGTYTVTLTVTDTAGQTDSAGVTISVEDQTAPTANATVSDGTVQSGETVTFDGSGSSDNVGIESYEWDFGDGSTATGESVDHAFETDGTYPVTLTVNDDAGNSATETVTVEVATDENEAPTAALSANASMVGVDEPVRFDAGESSDDSGIAEYRWDLDGDGTLDQSTADPATSQRYQSPGNYTVSVTVVDAAGLTDTATLGIQVRDQTAPTASITASATTVDVGTVVDFDASGSTDNVGIDSYTWDFDDGSTAIGAQTSHDFAAAGTYVVSLTVTDGAGNTATETVTITVEATGDGGSDDGGSDGDGSDGGSDDSSDDGSDDGSGGSSDGDAGDSGGAGGVTSGGASGGGDGGTQPPTSDESDEDPANEPGAGGSGVAARADIAHTDTGLRLTITSTAGADRVDVPLNGSMSHEGVSIDRLVVGVDGEVQSVALDIGMLSHEPGIETPLPESATALGYFDLEPTNLSPDNTLTVDVRFTVDPARLPENAIPDQVALAHHDGESWELLETGYIEANGTYVATAEAFSPFAIVVDESDPSRDSGLDPADIEEPHRYLIDVDGADDGSSQNHGAGADSSAEADVQPAAIGSQAATGDTSVRADLLTPSVASLRTIVSVPYLAGVGLLVGLLGLLLVGLRRASLFD